MSNREQNSTDRWHQLRAAGLCEGQQARRCSTWGRSTRLPCSSRSTRPPRSSACARSNLQVQETQERIAYVAKQTRPDRCGVVVRTLGGVPGRGHMGTRPTRCQAGATAVEYNTGRFHLGHNRAYRKAEWGQITQISPCGSDYYRITLSTSLVERAGYAVSQAAWLAKLDPRHAVMNCDVDGVVLIGSQGPSHADRQPGTSHANSYPRSRRSTSRSSRVANIEVEVAPVGLAIAGVRQEFCAVQGDRMADEQERGPAQFRAFLHRHLTLECLSMDER